MKTAFLLFLITTLNCYAVVKVGDTEASALKVLGEIQGKIALPGGKYLYSFQKGEITVSAGKVISLNLISDEEYQKRQDEALAQKNKYDIGNASPNKNNLKNDEEGKKAEDLFNSNAEKMLTKIKSGKILDTEIKPKKETPNDLERVLARHLDIKKDKFYNTYTLFMKTCYWTVGYHSHREDKSGGKLSIHLNQDGEISLASIYDGEDWIYHDCFSLKFPDGSIYHSSKNDEPATSVNDDGEAVSIWECCSVGTEEGEKIVKKITSYPTNSEIILRLSSRNFTLSQRNLNEISFMYYLSSIFSKQSSDPDLRKKILQILDKVSSVPDNSFGKYTVEDAKVALTELKTAVEQLKKETVAQPGTP